VATSDYGNIPDLVVYSFFLAIQEGANCEETQEILSVNWKLCSTETCNLNRQCLSLINK
jgi:hypothetical protein